MSSPTSSLELLAELDRASPVALHEQLTRSLRGAIRSGRLPAASSLPSSRRLATDLGVSRALVVETYAQLAAEGYVIARQGAATRVADLEREATGDTRAPGAPARFDHDLRPGRPDPALFPRGAWSAATRHVLSTISDQELGAYPDPAGPKVLRATLSAYLGRVRGVAAAEDRIVVCGGVAQGLGLAAAVLVARGVERVGVEDPSSPGTREVLTAAGLTPVAVPVDERGLVVDALERSGAEAVLVTPAHQFPLGMVLDAERRAELRAWARAGGWVLEDDYDAEFRYDRAPVGALQGLAPERVLYVGSVSKTLSPALRLGWVVAPESLAAEIADRKRISDLGCSTLDALALARLMTVGEHDRHLRRARKAYRRRRDALTSALLIAAPHLPVLGAAAGVHLVVELPDAGAEARAVEGAALARVAVAALGDHYLDARARHGLLLGYAGMPEPTLAAAATRLGRVLTDG